MSDSDDPKIRLKQYHWYSLVRHTDGKIGQCMGFSKANARYGPRAVMRYQHCDPWRTSHVTDVNDIIAEVDDPRYLVRIGKTFGRLFLNLDFVNVKN